MAFGMRSATVERIPVQDRPRDIMGKIRETTDRGDPIDEVAVNTADQYGKRPVRYEHQDIVLSNEHIAIIDHIKGIVEGAKENVAKLEAYANDLIGAFGDRVINFTVLVNREKDVIGVSYDMLKELHARITETRNAKTTHAPRGNGNGSAHANGGSEPHDGEELRHAPSDEEGTRAQVQGPR